MNAHPQKFMGFCIRSFTGFGYFAYSPFGRHINP